MKLENINNLFMFLGNKIKELREKNGLLQRQIANLLNIDSPMYSKFERGERLPKEEHIHMFADIFRVQENELRTLWLADKVLKTVSNEPDINQDAIRIVHNKLNCNPNV